MQRFVRIIVAIAFLVALGSAASAILGRPAAAGVDPCATVSPTEDVATEVPATFTPTLFPGVTETVDSSTITAPAATDTATTEPTNTEPAATSTATEFPPTNTEPAATNTVAVPTNTFAVPTNTFAVPTSTLEPINRVVNNLGSSNRVLNQIVDCETPAPVATSPVTNLPNTGTGGASHTTSIAMVLLLLVIAAGISMRARHAFKR